MERESPGSKRQIYRFENEKGEFDFLARKGFVNLVRIMIMRKETKMSMRNKKREN